MTETALAQLAVAVIALGSVVGPFLYPVKKGDYEPLVVLERLDPKRKRQRIAAGFLLILLSAGFVVMLTKQPFDIWAVIAVPLPIFVLLVELLPDRAIERFLIPVGRAYLVAVGMIVVVLLTLAMLSAAFSAQMAVHRIAGNYTFLWQLDKNPGIFWYYLGGTALLNFAAVRGLREWFVFRYGAMLRKES